MCVDALGGIAHIRWYQGGKGLSPDARRRQGPRPCRVDVPPPDQDHSILAWVDSCKDLHVATNDIAYTNSINEKATAPVGPTLTGA